mgnify:CR=1 FL=1
MKYKTLKTPINWSERKIVGISDQAHKNIPELMLIASNDLGMPVNMGQSVSWAINQVLKTSK